MKKLLVAAIVIILTLIFTLPVGTVAAGDPPVNPPTYVMAAHAVVQYIDDGIVQEETAWADCNNSQPFPGDSWAWYFTFPGNDDDAWGLYAGQNTWIGWVRVAIVDDGGVDKLQVTFNTTGNWYMVETHLAIAEPLEPGPSETWQDLIDDQWEVLPSTKKGNPKVGQFADLYGNKTGETHAPTQQVIYLLDIP